MSEERTKELDDGRSFEERVTKDMMQLRGDQLRLERRMDMLESRPQ